MNIRSYIHNLTIILIVILATHQFAVARVIRSVSQGSSAGSSASIQISDGASESEIIAAIIPQEKDVKRPYSWQGNQVTLSVQTPGNGYDMLVAMNRIQLQGEEERSRYAQLTKRIYHPCCDVSIANCGCKHAVAAQGLIKYLITQQDYSDEEIMNEVFLWNRFWWPKHYATAAVYLNNQGTNPAEVSVEDWLGPKLSTFRSGRRMRASLGVR